MNKFQVQYFSSTIYKPINGNLNTNSPILINSKEVLDNYEKDKLSVDLLNSIFPFSP